MALASAEAYASSDDECGCGRRVPHSFSTMVCLSFEASDITAALARCAMSRMESPGVFAGAGSAGRGDAGAIAAT